MRENNQKQKSECNPFLKEECCKEFTKMNCEGLKQDYKFAKKASHPMYGENDGISCQPPYPSFNKGLCGIKKEKNTWQKRYLTLQAEMIEDNRKWAQRFECLLEVQREQIEEYRYNAEKQLEMAYEEAYLMLKTENDKCKRLEKENQELKSQIKEFQDL